MIFFRLITSLIVMAATIPLVQAKPRPELVITFGGDISLNRTKQKPLPQGSQWGSKVTPWRQLTRHVAKLINGDLNFGNIETVVTSRRDLRPGGKAYAFQSHPNGIKHLQSLGFNLFSLANNHSYDYGQVGVMETRKHMARLGKRGRAWSAGIGRNLNEATRPVVFTKKGYRIAFSAIGIATNSNKKHHATATKPGSAAFRYAPHYKRVLQRLKKVKADYKILSIHYGTERQITLNVGQRRKFERAVNEAGVDLVIGHHPHVVRALQKHRGRVILYSLGNYIMRGAANMAKYGTSRDFGLFGRLYLSYNPKSRRLEAQAIEVVPLTQMHSFPRPMKASAAKKRVRGLNKLSRKSVGKNAITLEVKGNGSGVQCLGTRPGRRARAICRPKPKKRKR